MHRYTLALLPCAALSMGSVSGSAGEVVGANGRIGSLLLRAGLGTLAAVPRGTAPGALSPAGSPIIVATHASALTEVLEATPVDRVCDIVLLCNGMAREEAAKMLGVESARQITVGCIFFGVPAPGGSPSSGGTGVPPTALAGPHASAVAALIESMGPRCEVLPDLEAIESVSQLKMVWSSALWLLCAARGCNVGEAHALHRTELRGLIGELLRECDGGGSARDTAWSSLEAYSNSMPTVVPSAKMALGELAERNGWFMRRAATAGRSQPVHESLLLEVGVSRDGIGQDSNGSPQVHPAVGDDGDNHGSRLPPVLWRHAPSGLGFYTRGRVAEHHHHPGVSTALVIGAGIVGSAVALDLARMGVRVTVVDQRPPPQPATSGCVSGPNPSPTPHPNEPPAASTSASAGTSGGSGGRNGSDGGDGSGGGGGLPRHRAQALRCTDATSGSWAWLNANGKLGTYGALNRLGMAMWRREAPYSELAVWCGALVASTSNHGEDVGGAYAVNADVSAEHAAALEPCLQAASRLRTQASGSSSATTSGGSGSGGDGGDGGGGAGVAHLHHYPDEGLVSPKEAVTALQAEAVGAGSTFLWDTAVMGLLRDQGTDRGASGERGQREGRGNDRHAHVTCHMYMVHVHVHVGTCCVMYMVFMHMYVPSLTSPRWCGSTSHGRAGRSQPSRRRCCSHAFARRSRVASGCGRAYCRGRARHLGTRGGCPDGALARPPGVHCAGVPWCRSASWHLCRHRRVLARLS